MPTFVLAGYNAFVSQLTAMKEISGVIGVLFLFAIGVSVCLAVYKGIDNSGWIPHHEETTVLIKGVWLVGEFKDCQMQERGDGHLLDCSFLQGDPHDLAAKYWGRLDREMAGKSWAWRCQRMEASITCRAVN
jgi:hypothetical protein